jgi:hypothetical protein
MEVLQRTANRGSISTGGYEIGNSCKFEADNTEYLERDPSSAGDRQKFTTSMWVKRTELGQASTIFGVYPTSSVGDTTVMQFGFMSDDKFQLGLQTYYVFNTTRLFRDTSAWYHIVVAFDTTQSTAANRIKLYVNGIQETAFDVEAYPNQNHSTGVNFTEPHRIGTLISNSWYFSGYIAEVNHIDGSQLAPTSFGEFDTDSGIWKPKAFSGSYGTNGFFLDFADAADLGDDESGNGNDFTENNITAADQATDTPTNNFAVMNPLNPSGVYTEGATKVTSPTGTYGGDSTWTTSTIPISTGGKWYCEVKLISTTNNYWQIGLCKQALANSWNYTIMYRSDGLVLNPSGSEGNTSSNTTFAADDIMGMAYDSSARTVKFYKNGSLVLTRTAGALSSGEDYFWGVGAMSSGTFITNWNFGGYTASAISSAATDANGYGTFEYAPPSGYYALCTKNLAEFG